jgi:hypothetical protein
MIEESLLKSNFIGRDGFRWWIGQVAPVTVQDKQANKEGWGNRCKVRIMGYHPYSQADLPDNDLPWAQVLLPTTAGTGAANYATNTKLRPSDVVFGFFMDGDNAQIPVILGCFGRTSEVLTDDYKSPFVPFTGYTDRVPPPAGDKLSPDQTNEQSPTSQKSPRNVPGGIASKLNSAAQAASGVAGVAGAAAGVAGAVGAAVPKEVSYFSGVGQKVVFGNTCNSLLAQGISAQVNNLIDKVSGPLGKALDVATEINRVVDKVATMANGFVGQMFNSLFNRMIPILQKGLAILYKKIFAKVYAITPGEASIKFAAAHAAGVIAQTAMMNPVSNLEKAISCVASKVVNGLFGLVENLIKSTLDNVKNFNSCAGTQFTGALLNGIIDDIVSGLDSPISGVAKILTAGFSVEGFLRNTVDSIRAIGGLFDCNQGSGKCSGIVDEWTTGCGQKKTDDDSLYNNILNTMNIGKELGNFDQVREASPEELLADLNAVNKTISSNIGTTSTSIRLRDVVGVEPNQMLSIGGEVMRILTVNRSSKEITVQRNNPVESYEAGSTVRISEYITDNELRKTYPPSTFEQLVGSYDIFSSRTKNPKSTSAVGKCYTGDPLSCNPPEVRIFGGGGRGATGKALLGNVKPNGTASIIGVKLTNPGRGYRYPAFIEFFDNCKQGYGAVARTTVKDGKISSVYMVSIGENYPFGEPANYVVDFVVIDDPGGEYSQDIVIKDNFGNSYETTVESGIITKVIPINSKVINDLPQFIITSTTGSGVVLRAVLTEIGTTPTDVRIAQGPIEEIDVIGEDGVATSVEVGIRTDSARIGQQRDLKQVIDCITN